MNIYSLYYKVKLLQEGITQSYSKTASRAIYLAYARGSNLQQTKRKPRRFLGFLLAGHTASEPSPKE